MMHDYPTATQAANRNGRFPAPSPPLITAKDAQELVQPVENLIVKYPAAALASAFLIGVALAWWIKRK
jgi:hypothetical protein